MYSDTPNAEFLRLLVKAHENLEEEYLVIRDYAAINAVRRFILDRNPEMDERQIRSYVAAQMARISGYSRGESGTVERNGHLITKKLPDKGATKGTPQNLWHVCAVPTAKEHDAALKPKKDQGVGWERAYAELVLGKHLPELKDLLARVFALGAEQAPVGASDDELKAEYLRGKEDGAKAARAELRAKLLGSLGG